MDCVIYITVIIKLSVAEIAQLGERQTEDLKVPGCLLYTSDAADE